jgi:NADH-quinone oxidoreductase subunit A
MIGILGEGEFLGSQFFRPGCFPLPKPGRFFKVERMDSQQFQQYLPVLLLGLVAIVFAFGTLVASVLAGKSGRRNQIKDTAYECGMLPVGEGTPRLSVKFHLVAMLFILFDIEVVFLYPWAVVYKTLVRAPGSANVIFGSMVSFLTILFVGYIYALKKQAFVWKR